VRGSHSLRSRTPARRCFSRSRWPRDHRSRPAGPCDALGAHEEIVVELPEMAAADAYDRRLPISRWNGQPAYRAVPEERRFRAEPGRTAIHVAVRASVERRLAARAFSSREGERGAPPLSPVVVMIGLRAISRAVPPRPRPTRVPRLVKGAGLGGRGHLQPLLSREGSRDHDTRSRLRTLPWSSRRSFLRSNDRLLALLFARMAWMRDRGSGQNECDRCAACRGLGCTRTGR